MFFVRWLAAVLLLAMLPVAQAASSVAADEADIHRWIKSHMHTSKSDELSAARSSVVGDLDGDARNDRAVLYTLKPREQPNERRYLAVFMRRDGRLRYQAHVMVGGTGVAEANRATILNKTVVVETLTFRAGDAACCPTRPATRRYHLSSRGLVLVKEAAKAAPGAP